MQWLQDTFAALTSSEATTSGQDHVSGEVEDVKELQSEGQLSRGQLQNFFEEASKQLRSEEYRRKLKDAFLLKQVKIAVQALRFAVQMLVSLCARVSSYFARPEVLPAGAVLARRARHTLISSLPAAIRAEQALDVHVFCTLPVRH